jgi:hypothetical protein
VRQQRRKAFALGGVLALITLALALVLASGGTAASGKICKTPTTSSNLYASCVAEIVSPHVLTAGGTAVSLTAFKNESGPGGANASHVALKVTFNNPVSVSSVGWSLNGSTPSNSGCTTPASNLSSVSCSVGNVAGGGKVVMVVQFSTSTAETLNANVQYGEGAAQPNSVPNDSQDAKPDSLSIASGNEAGGNCFDKSSGGMETGFSALQQTTVTVSGDASLTLPCMPIDAGVRDDGFTTQTSFFEFPLLSTSTAPAVLVIKFTPLPTSLKLKTFPLYEDRDGNGTFELTVPPCNPQPTPIPAGNDSCIFNRASLRQGGAELDLYVTGSLLDSSYHG